MMYFHKKNKKFGFSFDQRGQIALIVTLFFIALSLVLTFGIINPVLRHAAIVRNIVQTKNSLFLSESGIEDILYRLKKSKRTSALNTLFLDGHQVDTTVVNLADGKLITSVSNFNDYLRSLEVRLVLGVGTSFHYGLQTGTGGLLMSNNAVVDGNVYSNGSIQGANQARITGSAYSANSAALSADQTNESPVNPPFSVVFGTNASQQDFAQSFIPSATGPINKITVLLKKVGTPGNLTARIVTDNAGSPSNNTIAQSVMAASLVTVNYGWIDIPLSSNPELTAGNTYWLVLDGGNNASRYYIIGANNAYAAGTGKAGAYGGVWNNTTPVGLDGYFKVFLGGLTGSINNINAGTGPGGGDINAHTVTNSSVTGNLYCQSGSGNNKACNTSMPDPSPQPFPISDGNISLWKTYAEAGGVINGDLVLDGAGSSTLGPKKINGNLTINNGYNLTLTGVVWVTGNVFLSNGISVRLATSYGTNSGVIVSDGYININNNTNFYGSGQAGSYVMLVTTSECPDVGSCAGNDAVYVGNNAGAIVINAQKGSINFNNNAGAKSATGKKIILSNGAVISYEIGLINVNFTSGPGGGFDIMKWKEIE